ncbi:unnamed protein product [Rodentolepis nana]|uniref:ULP_PROTEASE domain-containing protein n=1 Tax=Rodentolepis nana TaxID=102285 RepID=A0A158QI89_RODNA|nr:unnamed protein product [Rodentolepis nana]
MPSPPQWSYLINKDNPIKRRRVSNVESIDWFSSTNFRITRSNRSRRFGLRPRRSSHSSPKIPHFRTIEDSIVLIEDSSDDEPALDKVLDISTDELNCSDVYVDNRVNNGDTLENPASDDQLIDIIDDEMAKEVENASLVVVSEDSDVEVVEPNHMLSSKLNKELNNLPVESFIAESELDPQVMNLLELPSKKELRCSFESPMFCPLAGTNSQHESQIFTIKSVVLPSSHLTSSEHVILNTTKNDILVLPTTYFSPSQLALVQSANSLKCFLNVTLTQPWREMSLQDTDSARIIFSPSGVDVQEIPVNTTVPDLQRVPLLCFLILNAMSRIDLIEIQESSPVEQLDDDVYISPLSFTSKDSKRKNFSLVEISGLRAAICANLNSIILFLEVFSSTPSSVITNVDSSKSQVWSLCPGCLLDSLEETVRSSENSNGSSSTFQCSRCQAKCDRPFRAVEIVVEMTHTNQKRISFKVSILPSYLAALLKIAESRIYCSESLNPKRLIGQSVTFPFGLLIRLSRFKSAGTDFVIQLHPNLFF